MVKDASHSATEGSTSVNIKIIKRKESAPSNGLMEENIPVLGKKVRCMVEEY